MRTTDLLEQKLGRNNVYLNELMSNHTSFKTGGPAEIFVKVHKIEELKYVLEIAKNAKLPIFILGNGSNILVTDKGIKGIVCKIEINKFEVQENINDIYVIVGARKQKC